MADHEVGRRSLTQFKSELALFQLGVGDHMSLGIVSGGANLMQNRRTGIHVGEGAGV